MVAISILLIQKSGEIKSLLVKDFQEEELHVKCGFKKPENFAKQTEWVSKVDGIKYHILLFAKTEGRANHENIYDFPPPVDTKLFFGTCALIAKTRNEDDKLFHCNLSVPVWDKIYEKLFGGFEDLGVNAEDDEEEADELEKVDKKHKTKSGYLKDGFVVDSSDAEDDEDSTGTLDSDDDDDEKATTETEEDGDESIIDLSVMAEELAEEEYDYSDLKPNK